MPTARLVLRPRSGLLVPATGAEAGAESGTPAMGVPLLVSAVGSESAAEAGTPALAPQVAPTWEETFQSYANTAALQASSRYFYSDNPERLSLVTGVSYDGSTKKFCRLTIPDGTSGNQSVTQFLSNSSSYISPTIGTEMWIEEWLRLPNGLPAYPGGFQDWKQLLVYWSSGSRFETKFLYGGPAYDIIAGRPGSEQDVSTRVSQPALIGSGAWFRKRVHFRGAPGLLRWQIGDTFYPELSGFSVAGQPYEISFGARPLNIAPAGGFTFDHGYRAIWVTDPGWGW